MSFEIKDGTGTGKKAKVNSDNRLYTNAVTRSDSADASIRGDSYNINTGVINLTSANKSAVFYFKNTGTKTLDIGTLFYLIGNSTGGSGDMLISVLRNPTTGTIIDNAVTAEMAGINRNFSSANTLEADIYKGAEGYTFTNGTKVIESIFNQAPTRAAINVGSIVLEKGNSIGIDITPATSNTSLDVEFAIAVHIDT